VKRDQFTQYQFSADGVAANGVRKSAPAPAVMNTGDIDDHKNWRWADMTEAVQYFWVDLLSIFLHSKLFRDLDKTRRNAIITDFKGMTLSDKFVTNDKGTDKFRNYITGENKDKENPRQAPLVCVDDWVRVLQEKTNRYDVLMGQLDSFLVSEPFPIVTKDLLKDPRVLWATIITKEGTIRNFPQLDGIPVPYPYITVEHWWYPMADLEKVN
jgi:hypothetical protein